MKEQLLTRLENSRNYTLEVIKKMPEANYDFKPVDTSWNFIELANHIAYSITWWQDNYILQTETGWNPPAIGLTKAETISRLEEAYESLKKVISSIQLTNEILVGFFSTIDHITHHRGQAVLYLRCNNIPAAEYRF
jgi:uncharacterized damage-inducible protein DinB